MSCTVLCFVRAATDTHCIEHVSPESRGGPAYAISPLSPMLSVAHPAFVSIMSVPRVPTNPEDFNLT